MKKLFYPALALALSLNAPASFSQMHKKNYPFPDAGEYKVLKCDFHQHTVFSDGQVWPKTRVVEAWEEDLDAIALTEHIEHKIGRASCRKEWFSTTCPRSLLR